MKKKRCLALFLFLLALPLAAAQGEIEITFKDSQTNAPITDIVITMKMGQITLTQYVGKDGILRISDEYEAQYAEFYGDYRYTAGKDYYGNSRLPQSALELIPVGSLRGIVKDKYDNVISYAELQFDCTFDYDFPKATDKFGSFSLDAFPVGSCRVFAGFKDSVDVEDVPVEQGELIDVELKLDKSIISEDNKSSLLLWYGLSILLIIVVVLFYLFWNKMDLLWKKEKKHEKKQEKEIKILKAAIKLGKRGKDVYETLSGKEKRVVDFLLTQPKHTTQSKIHHELNIAKSSLFRTIGSLERKNVVVTEKTAKARRITLSEWFLEK